MPKTLLDFTKQHSTIRKNVIDLSKRHPEVIDDYRKLIQYYWYYVDGLKSFIPLDILEKLTQPESIGRAFRKAIEQEQIQPSTETQIARNKQERLYKNYYRRAREGE